MALKGQLPGKRRKLIESEKVLSLKAICEDAGIIDKELPEDLLVGIGSVSEAKASGEFPACALYE